MTDQLLIRRCISGDAEAWRQLLDSCSPTLRLLARTTVRSLGAPQDDAHLEDTCSAVLESLVANDFRILRMFRWQCSFESWLRVLVRTAVIRSLRRKIVDRRDIPVHQTPERPLERILSNESRDLVREEVEDLPERERTVLTLFFVDGKSYREIASRLNLPMGTVATLLARTRASLRKRLEKRGLAEDE